MKSILALLALALGLALNATTRAADIIPAEARAIAKEAYIYSFPLVDSYRIQYAYWIDPANPEYKAPLNRLVVAEQHALPTADSSFPSIST
jgi:hypothetical protein